jgi:4-amino-4-deoxy-L-arabinose transferase-like glycosyltransferase
MAVFSGLFLALTLSHWSLLRLPYYWDEAGYYIPAAWDFFRSGSLIPFSTLSNAHPPLPSLILALAWKLFSYAPLTTRLTVVAVSALALTAVWRLALKLTGNHSVAFWTTALTALYPVWFAQSTLAHADIFAAAGTLWGLLYALPEDSRKPWAAALCFSAAALAKETAIVVPLTLAAMVKLEALWPLLPLARLKASVPHPFRSFILERVESQDARSLPNRKRLLSTLCQAAWLASCLLPLALWYVWHWHKTGFLFGNPEFLRYNAQANLEPARFWAAFSHRLLHLTAHMNLFVPVLLALGSLLLPLHSVSAGEARPALTPLAVRRILLLLLANAIFFSVLGGALLTRYLLPVFPLVLLLAVTALWRHTPWPRVLLALSATAFVAALFINPPYGFAPEDNLAYARLIRLHQAGIAQLNARYPGATALTAWPLSDALTRPELGYLQQPIDVYTVADFTAASLAPAAQEPGKYAAALVFSTKIDPQSSFFTLGSQSRADDERFFGLHQDLPPALIARTLGGTLVWQEEDQGLWVALIRCNPTVEATRNR